MTDESKCQVCNGACIGMVWGVRVCGACLAAWSKDCEMPSNTDDHKAMEHTAKSFLRKRRDQLKARAA